MSNRLFAVFTPFENLTDPRVERTREHALLDLVVVALLGTIAGADSWVDIERFGKERLGWLKPRRAGSRLPNRSGGQVCLGNSVCSTAG